MQKFIYFQNKILVKTGIRNLLLYGYVVVSCIRFFLPISSNIFNSISNIIFKKLNILHSKCAQLYFFHLNI